MSQTDTEETILSETAEEQAEVEGQKLVPVAESIRYRKRAQSAEKKIEILAEQLAQAKSQAAQAAEKLNTVRSEQKLMRKLAAAGAVDVETAVLLAKARMEDRDGDGQADLDGVVEQLKKEKQYLFAGSLKADDKTSMTARKTAGVKDRTANGQTVVERAARKAATTGNRADLQEYLKLRRNFL